MQSYEENRAIALMYNTVSDFSKQSNSAYQIACRNHWLDSYIWLTRQRPKKQSNRLVHTFEEIFEIAKNYHTRTEFARAHGTLYTYALNHKWLDKFDWMQKPRIIITEKLIKSVASKFDNIHDFRINESDVYHKSRKFNMIFPYMGISKEVGKISKEDCAAIKNKYINTSSFQHNNHDCFIYALYQGWIDEWFNEDGTRKPPINKEECFQIASNYKNKTEFLIANRQFYQYACENGWIDEWFNNDTKHVKPVYDFTFYENIESIPTDIDKNKLYIVHSFKHPDLPAIPVYSSNPQYTRDAIRRKYKKMMNIPLKDISICGISFYNKKYKSIK